jgi:hypothetical protein
MSTAKEAAKRDNSKFTFAITGSIFFAIAVCVLIAVNRPLIGLPPLAIAISLPILAYGYSLALSVGSQYMTCGSINIRLITVQNLLVLGSNAIVTGLLFLESISIKKYIFGEYPPRHPITQELLDPASKEYTDAITSESHYKLQFFSGVVKAVLPLWMDEGLKDGLVYCYYIFWMNVIPLLTLLGIQTTCS